MSKKAWKNLTLEQKKRRYDSKRRSAARRAIKQGKMYRPRVPLPGMSLQPQPKQTRREEYVKATYGSGLEHLFGIQKRMVEDKWADPVEVASRRGLIRKRLAEAITGLKLKKEADGSVSVVRPKVYKGRGRRRSNPWAVHSAASRKMPV